MLKIVVQKQNGECFTFANGVFPENVEIMIHRAKHFFPFCEIYSQAE